MSDSLAAAQSHNVPPEIFLRHFREIRDATRAMDEARMAVARLKKAAKSDGIDLGALAIVEKMRKLDDDEAEMRMQKAFRYAEWLGQPLGTQPALFPDMAPRPPEKAEAEQKEWAAGEAGYLAGKGGKLREENPFPPNGPLYVAWDKNWLRGLKVLAAELKAKADAQSDKKQAKKAPILQVGDVKGATPPKAPAPRRGRAPNGSTPLH